MGRIKSDKIIVQVTDKFELALQCEATLKQVYRSRYKTVLIFV